MRINNNIMALNTHRQYAINNENVAKATEKLSSGYRVNRAGDDAAGLAISEKMRAQIRGLNMASKNSQDAISLLQTAEGALTETHNILQRMRELSVQSSSDTNQDAVDRVALNNEFQQLKTEINDISSKTKFNNMNLLDGTFGVGVDLTASNTDSVVGVASITATGAAGKVYTFASAAVGGALSVSDGTTTVLIAANGSTKDGAGTITVDLFGISIKTTAGFVADNLKTTHINMAATGDGTIQTGANAGDTFGIAIGDMSTTGLSIAASLVDSRANAALALTSVNSAINSVSAQRASLGAYQNRLSYKINNLDTAAENLQAAESRIRDLDMAKEMTNFTRNNILSQASTAMLAQANNAPQGVLKLLQ